MVNKKIPLRRCVVTNTTYPKKELIRIVKNKDGNVFIDLTSKANGRGAYLKLSEEVVLLAQKKGSLKRALGCEIPEEIYKELLDLARKN